MAIGSSSDKAPQAQVTFESAIGSGRGLEVGPLSFQAVVVDLGQRIIIPTDVAAMPFFGFISQIIQGGWIAVQAIGNHICFSQAR